MVAIGKFSKNPVKNGLFLTLCRGIAVVFLLTSTSQAEPTHLLSQSFAHEPTFKAKITAQTTQAGLELTIIPKTNTHVNVNAPIIFLRKKNQKRVQPSQISQNQIRFLLLSPEDETMSLSFYICDDANTLCEKQGVDLHWESPELHLAK